MNWFEKEEQNLKNEQPELIEVQENFLEKKLKVTENYSQNKDKFDSFILDLKNLVEKVNKLPIKARWDFGKINFKNKKNGTENKFYTIGCSRKIVKRNSFFGFIPIYSKIHYKNVRKIIFFISSEFGYVDFEVKDTLLRKHRINHEGDIEKTRKHRNKNYTYNNKDFYKYKINDLNESLAVNIIDWICFKTDYEVLPFERFGYKIS